MTVRTSFYHVLLFLYNYILLFLRFVGYERKIVKIDFRTSKSVKQEARSYLYLMRKSS